MTLNRFWVIGLALLAEMASAEDLITIYYEAARTNPELAAVAASLEAVRESRPQAIAGLLPVLDVNGAVERQRLKTFNESQPTNKTTSKLASLDLIQPLFRYDRWIQLKQSDSEIASAEVEYAAAQQDLMLLVAERYFGVLDAQDNLEFIKAEKSAIGRQLEQATQRFEVGLIAITDAKAAQARYDLSVSGEIRALSEVTEAKDALREVVGTFYDQLTSLKPDLELARPNPSKVDAWVDKAVQQNLRVLAAQATTETARQEMRIQRAGHLPTLDLNANTSYVDREFGGVVPQKRHDSAIGVRLNIPLFKGGAVNSRTREARSRFEEAQKLLQQQKRSAEFDTRNAYRGILTDIAQVNALAKSLESTEVAIAAEEAGFEVGTRTIVDVLDAQRENFLARLNYARARYLYVLDQLRLKRAVGNLLVDDLAEVNDALGTGFPQR